MKPVKTLFKGLLLGAAGAAFSLSGCKKKDKDDHDHSSSGSQPDSVWVEVMHEHPGNAHVYVYALLHRNQNGQVREGYNRFRIKVEGYNGTDVKLVPIMYMTNHSHSCPVQQPDGRASDGYFYAEAFFQMPTTVQDGNVTEPWKLHVILNGRDTATAEVRIHPHPNGWVRRKMFGTDRLLYEFRPEGALRATQIPVQVYLYRRDMNIPHEDPAGFPPAFDRVDVVQLNTWMPSMNHGASGNQPATPIQGSFGFYKGQVGFNMTGEWEIYLAFVHQHGSHSDTLGMDTIRVSF